jgi:hypothetical protein
MEPATLTPPADSNRYRMGNTLRFWVAAAVVFSMASSRRSARD